MGYTDNYGLVVPATMSAVDKGSLVRIKCPAWSPLHHHQHTPAPPSLHPSPLSHNHFVTFHFSRMPTVRTTFGSFSRHATHGLNCRVIKLGRI